MVAFLYAAYDSGRNSAWVIENAQYLGQSWSHGSIAATYRPIYEHILDHAQAGQNGENITEFKNTTEMNSVAMTQNLNAELSFLASIVIVLFK